MAFPRMSQRDRFSFSRLCGLIPPQLPLPPTHTLGSDSAVGTHLWSVRLAQNPAAGDGTASIQAIAGFWGCTL